MADEQDEQDESNSPQPSGPPLSPPPAPGPEPAMAYPYEASSGGPGGRGGVRWPVVLAVVLVAAVGVGTAVVLTSDDGGPTTAPADLALDDLRPVLLTDDDLGDGWESVDVPEPVGESPDMGSSEECHRMQDEVESEEFDDAPVLQRGFEQGSLDRPGSLSHDLSLVEEGMPRLSELRDLLDECGEVTNQDGDVTARTELRPVDVDVPGDEVLAIRSEIQIVFPGEQPRNVIHGYSLFVRRGGVQSSIGTTAGFDDGQPSDEDVVESEPADVQLVHELAALVDQRLTSVLDG